MTAGHELKITIDSGDGLTATLVCNAPPGSPCNLWCEQGCEYPDEQHDAHPLVVVDCMVCEWWGYDSGSSLEGFGGPEQPARSGPIIVTSWGEDGIDWHYAEDIYVGQVITEPEQVAQLPRTTVLLCREHEVFWLPPSDSDVRQWLAAGYDPLIYSWSDEQAAEWGPLTILHIPPAALAD